MAGVTSKTNEHPGGLALKVAAQIDSLLRAVLTILCSDAPLDVPGFAS